MIPGAPASEKQPRPGGLQGLLHALRLFCLAPLVALGLMRGAHAAEFSSIVFFYGDSAPARELTRFDVAVVEAGHGFVPTQALSRHTRWLAYVSVGEVQASRPYFKDMPPAWLAGHNKAWGAHVVDQSATGWPEFFLDRVIRPLWKAGYRGFFLDTLDSYQLLGTDPQLLARQRQGLLQVIRLIRATYPRAMLILNRGFELLPELHRKVDAVAFESLYKGWNQAEGRYVDVPPPDRTWLLSQVAKVQAWHLPVVAIDYCPPQDRSCTIQTAARIRQHGIIPYIGDGHLQTVNLAVLP